MEDDSGGKAYYSDGVIEPGQAEVKTKGKRDVPRKNLSTDRRRDKDQCIQDLLAGSRDNRFA